MIRIGFEDDNFIDPDSLDEEGNPIEKHGDKFTSDKEELKEVYLSPKRIEQLKEEFSAVVVHEFGDEYHLSEEERRERDQLYDVFKKFRKYKHTYRNIVEYVTVMREALVCLKAVAENNGIYSEDEFIRKFLKKKITITGLRLPRYKGKDRKTLSWDFVTEFILSTDPPEDILPKPKEELIDDEDYEKVGRELFSEEEIEDIMKPVTEEQRRKYDEYFDMEEDKHTDTGMAVSLTRKEQKALIKSQPALMRAIKEGRKDQKSIRNLDRLAYSLTDDDLDQIELNDRKYGYESSSDMPKFKGDLSSNKDYHKYMRALEEFEHTQIKENYGGRLKTREQIEEIELKQELEANGWNLRNLYENKEKEKRLRKARKRDKEQEKKIKKKLLAVQERNKRRLGEDIDDDEYMSKKKKKKKKDAKKLKKMKKSKEKDVEEFMNQSAILRSDEIDFDEYEQDVLDWSSDNIFNKK